MAKTEMKLTKEEILLKHNKHINIEVHPEIINAMQEYAEQFHKEKLREFTNALYESKILHDYKDGKFDFRTVARWIREYLK